MQDAMPIFGSEHTKSFDAETLAKSLADMHKDGTVLELKSTVLKETIMFAPDQYRDKYTGKLVIYTYRDLYRIAKWKPKPDELLFLHAVLKTFPRSKIEGIKHTKKGNPNG